MNDPRTFWLVVTNVALAVVLVLLIVAVLTGVLCETVSKRRRRHAMQAEIDRDMRTWFGGHGIHK